MAEDDGPLVGSLADEEAAMRSGNSRMLIGWGVAVVALLAGLFVLMGGDDDTRVFSEVGKQINGLRQAHFDQFWGCALKGADLKDVKTNTDLVFQVEGRASKGGRSYAVHVREQCLPKLTEIEPQLDTLMPPEELKSGVVGMGEAAGALRSGWSGLIAYLDDPELEYDSDKADRHIKAIAKAWYDFKKAHGSINKVLKDKLR